MTNEIEKLTTDLAAQATGIQVVDQASASRATDLILLGKAAIKKIRAFYEIRKAKAHDLWKFECDEEKTELAKVQPVIDKLDLSLSTWRREEQRKREAAEAERLRIEREKQRLEEEALRKVKEAEERAERERQRLEREAERLQKEAVKKADDEVAMKRIEEEREQLRVQAEENRKQADEATDEAINIAAKAEAALPPVPVVPEAPRTAGLYQKHNYSFWVEDKVALPEEFKIADQAGLNAMARLKGEGFKIPGGKVVDNPTQASIGKRNGSSLN